MVNQAPPTRPTQAEVNRNALESHHLMADLAHRTAKGGLVTIVAQSMRMAVQFVTLAILARLLAPADFGLVAMAATVTGFATLFTDLGLSVATVQRKEIDQETVSALFLASLGVGFTVMVAVMAAAPLAAWFFDDGRIFWLVIALAVPIPLNAAGRQHAAILQRGMRLFALEMTGLAAHVLGGICAIYLAWGTDWGYRALVAQSWLTAFLSLILLWLVCPWRPSRIHHWHNAREALSFGLHMTGFQLLNYCNRQLDDVLIGRRWGAAELGYYSRAYLLLTLPLQLVNAPLGSALLPALSRLQTDADRWRAGYLEALGTAALVTSGITAVLIACAEPIVTIAFGPNWTEAGHIFLYLAISMFAANTFNMLGWIYISLGQIRRMMRWALLTAPVLIASFLIGLPYGGLGVARAYSVAVSILFVPALWYAAAQAPLTAKQLFRASAPPMACGIFCATLGRLIAPHFQAYGTVAGFVSTATVVGVSYIVLALGILLCDPSFQATKQRLRGYVVRHKAFK